MKLFVIFTCFVIAAAALEDDYLSFAGDFLEERASVELGTLKDILDNYAEKFVLRDPLKVANQSIRINGHYFNFTEAHIKGLSNVRTSKFLSANRFVTVLKYQFTLPYVSGEIKSFSSDLPNFAFNGDGSFSFKNFHCSTTVAIKKSGGMLPSKVSMSIGRVNVTIDGNRELSRKVSHDIFEIVNSRKTHQELGKKLDAFVKKFLSESGWPRPNAFFEAVAAVNGEGVLVSDAEEIFTF
ncbi:hypothetical protein PPYR_04437 [Photinus pyralis]|uniref:Lipid-binding serum glycoprotein N-terminal domain-containing protein n=2 Tax=Photinus pyralis TaxID=7054 RepID=A0A5N4AMY6_PHOPY|nr:uncharacterized protein LOC116164777 [Photinus pyralis]XP_031345142.1 uncharacterized protein LOC116172136 [Photinus pyralis]KAB0798700.1 hypothetical protein PPYR_09693 [Photinus pyralis]KAB0802251.1 hypothetical protein PPYR_04437 [Photinus pyralis]